MTGVGLTPSASGPERQPAQPHQPHPTDRLRNGAICSLRIGYQSPGVLTKQAARRIVQSQHRSFLRRCGVRITVASNLNVALPTYLSLASGCARSDLEPSFSVEPVLTPHVLLAERVHKSRHARLVAIENERLGVHFFAMVALDETSPRSSSDPSTPDGADKPQRTRQRKEHTKSRGGCVTCKQRHIRCDQRKPIWYAR